MKKTSIKIATVVLVLSLCISTIISYLNGGNKIFNLFHLKNASYSYTKNFKIPVSKINAINSNVNSGDIHVISSDKNDIEVEVKSQEDESKYDKFSVTQNNEVLDIEILNKNFAFNFNNNFRCIVYIYIPKEYSKNMDLKTDLGDIELENINIENLKCNSNLGNIVGKNIKTTDSTILTDKGDITLNGFNGNLTSENNLGNIDVDYLTFDNNVSLKNSKGDIRLNLPKEAEFYLDAEKNLGDFSIDFPVTIKNKNDKIQSTVVNDKNKVNLSTDLGDISILTNN